MNAFAFKFKLRHYQVICAFVRLCANHYNLRIL
jgi:hypothetical protein